MTIAAGTAGLPSQNGSRPPFPAREAVLTLGLPITAELLDQLADLVADRLGERVARSEGPTWLNAEQAADYIAAPVGRIHDLVSSRKLSPCRDGRRLLFRRADLDAYLEASA